MNKTLKVIIFFFFLLVPSVIYSGQSTMIASVNLVKVLNESDSGKNTKIYLDTLPVDQRKAKERELTNTLIREVFSVISEIGEEGEYDLILEEKRYLYSKNKIIDITDKVIEWYNVEFALKRKNP